MATNAYTEAVERLKQYRTNETVQKELNSTLHNSGELESNYAEWLDGCNAFLKDNYTVLKEWL